MSLFLLVLYNLATVAVAIAGVAIERRRPRLGIALIVVALLLVLNLFAGAAILFVPFIVALYGVAFGLPALGVWLLVRRLRRLRRRPNP